ncbi:MAG TPA: sugar transferase [Candidatus Limnocylindria bacterium]|nr:sugar transferase [Candidatus Limnocylindria bacterium]
MPETTTNLTPPETGATTPLALPERDVRRKRPPMLSFLMRWETARRIGRVATLMALDFAGVSLGIFTALILKAAVVGPLNWDNAIQGTKDVVSFAYLLTVLLFARSQLYAERPLRPGLSRIVASLFEVTVVALVFALINGEEFQSFYIFYGSLFFCCVYVSVFRWGYERVSGALLRAAGYRRRAVLVGSGPHIDDVATALSEATSSPVEVVGYVSPTKRPDNGLRALGTMDDMPRVLASERVQEVIIADPDFPQQRVVELVDQCHVRGVSLRVAPSTMEILMHQAEFVPGQTVPLFELKPPVFEGIDYALKRTFDLVVSTLLVIVLAPLLLALALAVRLSSRGPIIYRSTRPGIGGALLLALLSPLMLLIALGIKLTSRGPVLYRSIRPGIGGKPFACLKFRTMQRDAEHVQDELEEHNEQAGALFKIRQDPRITPVGRLLRRFSLDELPQLFNVLRGEMSLVGPRPLPQRDYDRLEDWHRKRYLVLPGMTGLWQVSGRSELDFDELVRLDFLYLERWSVWLDLSIILKTVPAVVRARGAW